MPARKRHDPVSRPIAVDGGEYTDDQFLNLRSDEYHYVCANPNDVSGGAAATDRYLSRGYEQVIYVEGGERPANGKVTPGQPVTHLGQWLLRCPIELFNQRAARGARAAEQFDRKTKKDFGLEDKNFGGRRIYQDPAERNAFEQEA